MDDVGDVGWQKIGSRWWLDPVKIPNIGIVTIESPLQSVSSKYPKIWDCLLTTAKQLYKGAIIPYFLTSRSKVWAPRGQRANRTHAQPILLLESPGNPLSSNEIFCTNSFVKLTQMLWLADEITLPKFTLRAQKIWIRQPQLKLLY